MPQPSEFGSEWLAYHAGEKVKCPGRRLGHGRRAEDRGIPDRRQECKRRFIRVGEGEVYHVRWVGDRQNPIPANVRGTTIECWDCHTLFEVQVTE